MYFNSTQPYLQPVIMGAQNHLNHVFSQQTTNAKKKKTEVVVLYRMVEANCKLPQASIMPLAATEKSTNPITDSAFCFLENYVSISWQTRWKHLSINRSIGCFMTKRATVKRWLKWLNLRHLIIKVISQAQVNLRCNTFNATKGP